MKHDLFPLSNNYSYCSPGFYIIMLQSNTKINYYYGSSALIHNMAPERRVLLAPAPYAKSEGYRTFS
jgi:hypothetical protein